MITENFNTSLIYVNLVLKPNLVWRCTEQISMQVFHIPATCVDIRQHRIAVLRDIANQNTKVLNILATNVSIRQAKQAVLLNTNKPCMKVLDIPVPSVTILQQERTI